MPDRHDPGQGALRVLRAGGDPGPDDPLMAAVSTAVEWDFVTLGDEPAAAAKLAGTDVFVTTVFTRAMGEAADRLRLIALAAAGYENIDPAAVPDGCAVTNAYEHERPIAEYVIGAAVMLDHQLVEADRSFRSGDWSMWPQRHGMYRELHGRTMAIIGLGTIGREVARVASLLGMRVIACTRTVPSSQDGEALGLEYIRPPDRLGDVMAEADFVVVATPLSPATEGLIGAAEIARMKPTAYLVNPARGPIVDEEALFKALRDGRIAGAALDTWWAYPEPGKDDPGPSRFPFHELNNVLMTPHLSGATTGTAGRRAAIVAGNIDRLAAGRPLLNVVAGLSRA